jgi:hypothetical protein
MLSYDFHAHRFLAKGTAASAQVMNNEKATWIHEKRYKSLNECDTGTSPAKNRGERSAARRAALHPLQQTAAVIPSKR